ncbi:MAG: hypothetical protein WC551_11150 [Patescibacteria group bacterium]
MPDETMKQGINKQIAEMLGELEASVKSGSRDLIAYASERRQLIAVAVAHGEPSIRDIVRVELLNIAAYAATEAVAQADKFDAAVVSAVLMSFNAFDTLLLNALQ